MPERGISLARRSASTSRSGRATTPRRSTGCLRPSSATGSTQSCPSRVCRKTVIARVVDKFILQLEAQLSDRNVTIELTDEAREWLVKNGYDEAMGARPMARVIQTQIKTPLADEVLFGRLKGGGVVKVVVTADETGTKKLSFVYPEGPAQPRLERDLIVAAGARRSRKRVEPANSDADDKEPAPEEP